MLRDVWPLQLVVRTPAVVRELYTLAFDDKTHFPELVDAILPVVSHASSGNLRLPSLNQKQEILIENHPSQVLELLAAVLLDDATYWPYGVDQTLERLTRAKPALARDPRMIKLKGIWDRR